MIRMFIRPLNCLLLTSILCWSSGSAQYVHDQAAGRSWVAAASHFGPNIRLDQFPKKSDERHKRDHCPICQMLAHMSADGVTPAVALAEHQPTNFRISLGDWHPPIISVHTFVPIRGPPVI